MAENFVRMTISIPADVRKRMDRCPKSVNWSAVAAEAFSVEADRHLSNKRKFTMSKVDLARLKKSLEDSESESYRDGRGEGFEWASKYADAVQLRRLQRYRETNDEVWEAHFNGDSSVAFNHLGPLGSIAAAAISRTPMEVDQRDTDEFYENTLGDDADGYLEDGEYMRGFFEGAIEAWQQAEAEM